jgi:hypothetical protein
MGEQAKSIAAISACRSTNAHMGEHVRYMSYGCGGFQGRLRRALKGSIGQFDCGRPDVSLDPTARSPHNVTMAIVKPKVEFDSRYSNRVRLGVDNDGRTQRGLRGIVGKRLTYRDSSVWPQSQ